MGSIVKSCLPWPEAVRAVARWLERKDRIDEVMAGLPRGCEGIERARIQHLVFGVVRHAGRIEAALGQLIAHPPRFITRAVLYVAGFELIDAGAEVGAAPKIVHHAVEQTKALASPAEGRLVNAVGRKLADALLAQRAPGKLANAETLAEFFSHPTWLVTRWLTGLGAGPTRALLEWNQSTGATFVRWRGAQAEGSPPAWLTQTEWTGFYEAAPGHWPQLEAEIGAGRAYVQDPGTRLAIDLMAPRAGETLLDACSAPGGKAIMMADRMGEGRIVAVDSSGVTPGEEERFRRLKENLGRCAVPGVKIDIRAADILREPLDGSFDGVLLDVPCSNTGVMRHRIDVKWRLQSGDFGRHSRQQAKLLAAGSRQVRKGGRLVYSTCSVDQQENQQVVDGFLAANPEFVLEESLIASPWTHRHDGAGVFRLRRT